MFVIIAVATDTRAVGAAAAIAIGGTVGLDALFGGPVTGASMNPARSFGPALVAGSGETSGSTWPGRCGRGAWSVGVQAVRGERRPAPDDVAPTSEDTMGHDAVAVITDIHANLPALEAALERIDELGIERVYCGGDLLVASAACASWRRAVQRR